VNLLFVAPRLPFPTDTGARIRTLNLLRQAIRSGAKVVLLAFTFGDQSKEVLLARQEGCRVITTPLKDSITPIACFKSLAKGLPLSVAKYRSPVMARRLVELINEEKIDVVHFDHIHMGQYGGLCKGVPFIVDEHNVECLILRRLADKEANPFKKALLIREYKAMARLEKDVCLKAHRILVVSEKDAGNLKAVCGRDVRTEVIPNGVDVSYFYPSAPTPMVETSSRPEEILVFTGSMDWLPNSDAIIYFCRQILPLIWEKKPDVRLYVVGKNPPSAVKQLAFSDKRIVVTGGVPDVRPYVAAAKAFIVPLRIGGGTRLKILEAMSMGKPVISTTIGAEGIQTKDGLDIILADEPGDFAKKTVALLESADVRKEISSAGRKLVQEHYDWQVVGRRLVSVYGQFVKSGV